tara:strand:+ start:909 stop:1169 length:261 start_codon:yes stop_codon:yes gene_type:complete
MYIMCLGKNMPGEKTHETDDDAKRFAAKKLSNRSSSKSEKSMAGSVLSRGGNSKRKIKDATRTLHKGKASSDEMRLSRKIQQDNND